MKELFDNSSYQISQLITRTYSTSFSMGIRLFCPSIRPSIYAIYAFVRYADEIVDSFHTYNKAELLEDFENDYFKALERGISLNPVLNSFQEIVHRYKLYPYVDDFLARMKSDILKSEYHTVEEYNNYIYGSADVVGLMCLRVFVNNDEERFNQLKQPAMYLGSAFQKVNFLRDIKNDMEHLGRSYFPNLNENSLTNEVKIEIIKDIENDFNEAYKGIVQLPKKGKLGVYLAYMYYLSLLKKLKVADSAKIMEQRIRVSVFLKCVILVKSYFRYKLSMV